MRILLSNDDGCHAQGLRCLADALRDMATVTIVAPDRNRSGTSHALTLDRPLRVRHDEPGVVAVDGTPTDCVHLAITGLLEQEPDMVISGINAGAN
ncbi:MAG: 5'/3'-nucleotidase SurE, partial [Candidatus Saccharimonadales bacterium]